MENDGSLLEIKTKMVDFQREYYSRPLDDVEATTARECHFRLIRERYLLRDRTIRSVGQKIIVISSKIMDFNGKLIVLKQENDLECWPVPKRGGFSPG